MLSPSLNTNPPDSCTGLKVSGVHSWELPCLGFQVRGGVELFVGLWGVRDTGIQEMDFGLWGVRRRVCMPGC